MDPLLLTLVPLFFLTALVYASAGFGGGSTYLALLVLFNLPYYTIPQIALICNIVVVTGGLYHYIKAKHLKLNRILPFVVTSIPLAYLGGTLPMSKKWFLLILGISLAVAGARLLFWSKPSSARKEISQKTAWGIGLPLGGLLGFVSGLVGIGGGIFLAPLLYFLKWGNPRQIAASASFFIFVNSLFGLWGQWTKSGLSIEGQWLIPLILAVFLGGQIGNRLSVGWLPLKGIQRVTASLILIVSIRIFWMAL